MNYNKKSVEDIEVRGKRVLCRCDFNVPTKEGKITSDKRIVAALPTINYLREHGAKVILCSHMGKPKGEYKPELSLQVVADRLSELLGVEVKMAKDVAGEDAKRLAAELKDGDVMLLENTRFVKGETSRPLGTGPYFFSEEGKELCLRRNRSWWQDNRAPVEYDTILLTAAKDPTAVRDSFEFGATSLVCADLNAPNAVGYRCDYELWDCPTTTMQYLGFNLYDGIFYQRELRAAVTHIIDRESLISTVYKGFGEAALLPCAPASPLYDEELARTYAYDPSAFTEALHRASVSSEYVTTLLVCSADPTRMDMANRIAEALTQAGLRTEVRSVDEESYRYRLSTGQFDLFIGEVRLSGSFDLSEFFRSYGSLCYGGIRSSGMEQLCYDALENSGNCYDLYRGVMENGYFCPLLFKSYAVMANRGVVGSLQPAVDNVFHLAGGRSLSDASVSYEELTAPETEETEETQNTEETEP